jgi:hypothetical protein
MSTEAGPKTLDKVKLYFWLATLQKAFSSPRASI